MWVGLRVLGIHACGRYRALGHPQHQQGIGHRDVCVLFPTRRHIFPTVLMWHLDAYKFCVLMAAVKSWAFLASAKGYLLVSRSSCEKSSKVAAVLTQNAHICALAPQEEQVTQMLGDEKATVTPLGHLECQQGSLPHIWLGSPFGKKAAMHSYMAVISSANS